MSSIHAIQYLEGEFEFNIRIEKTCKPDLKHSCSGHVRDVGQKVDNLNLTLLIDCNAACTLTS